LEGELEMCSRHGSEQTDEASAWRGRADRWQATAERLGEALTEQEQAFLTVSELARFLRVSRTTAYQLVWSRQVPRSRVGGQWRIPRAELERQLANGSRSQDLEAIDAALAALDDNEPDEEER
jgi:excisionase family DNA binding protein